MPTQTVDAPYSVLLVAGTAAAAATNAKYLLGFVNLDKAAQTATLAVVDNSGVNTAGLPQQAALGASAPILYPAPGIPVNGLNVTPSAALTGPGVAVLYRTNVG